MSLRVSYEVFSIFSNVGSFFCMLVRAFCMSVKVCLYVGDSVFGMSVRVLCVSESLFCVSVRVCFVCQ